ncbi:hypothetical protein GUJ93_ZPchr0004g39671 [Zizania palustris]|uniref:Uncharacterized protein n=1 Tax=Zizania palustris TaxID=103762 RepID=A0A8J5VBV4_ZIZPA|nr:hypothetical protein GUJ93_ZPchr0004g39671 [Zizania palustris]KAG8066678.1 hypothetical protein GUJ93_ZPchr0004g39671 [Zizania palustris]
MAHGDWRVETTPTKPILRRPTLRARLWRRPPAWGGARVRPSASPRWRDLPGRPAGWSTSSTDSVDSAGQIQRSRRGDPDPDQPAPVHFSPSTPCETSSCSWFPRRAARAHVSLVVRIHACRRRHRWAAAVSRSVLYLTAGRLRGGIAPKAMLVAITMRNVISSAI